MSSDSVLGFECAGLRMRPARLLHHLSNLLGHDLRHPQGRVDDFIYSVCPLIEALTGRKHLPRNVRSWWKET